MMLDRIVEKRKARLQDEKKRLPLEAMRREIEKRRDARGGFLPALKKDGVAVIAEIKKASPSAGLIREDFDPARIAREYEENGAAALSVLTEEDFFLGSAETLRLVKRSANIPVLRKDFIIDPWQVWQSAYLGADAILLIAAILSDGELEGLRRLADELDMDALVEVHDAEEMGRALRAGALAVGINNRDLRTFAVDVGTTARLKGQVPSGVTVVSESGIRTAQDMRLLEALGVDAALIGESLMRAGSIRDKMRELKMGGNHD